MKTAIIGGGAAGFFCAINLGNMAPDMEITIFEQQRDVLKKVAISGGGRCNCTNTFRDINDLATAYPRGARLLKKLFKTFGPDDCIRWFEAHDVPLTIQEDQCIFPKAQDSQAIIRCFKSEAKRLHIKIRTSTKITDPTALLGEYDFVVVTIGGVTNPTAHNMLSQIETTSSVPSLFTFNINDKALTHLMGLVVENAITGIPATKFRSQGPLLITHWGISGPATLKLSSHAARFLAEHNYQTPIAINWIGETNAEVVREHLINIFEANKAKLIENIHPFGLQSRLWEYLIQKSDVCGKRIGELSKKNINRIIETLTNDQYQIASRCQYKDEFVTCGGVSLAAVNSLTLESKQTPHLFFAGEVLDIDGITGGFNLQAAWTTGYVVAQSIHNYLSH